MNQNAKVVDDLVVDDCYICFTAGKKSSNTSEDCKVIRAVRSMNPVKP